MMPDADLKRLAATIRRILKARQMTYAMLAEQLNLSVPTIKRLLSTGQMTLVRLAEISNVLGMTLSELVRESEENPLIEQLTENQEEALVNTPKLLLVAVCVMNHWKFEEILTYYRLTESECVLLLSQLAKLQLIDWLPGNRIRLKIARTFRWRENGPIYRFFREEGERAFLKGQFNDELSPYVFLNGMLTADARREFIRKVHQLQQDFAVLHQQSLHAPLSHRHGVGVLFASRAWELDAFAALRKDK
ncbi:helix-turn-helix transcriptional regulator [Leeia sp. TBRC 13508]|uniref:Helix-turn-helix transcriptional regulator n=1 Tax=Leeia speluncae TaxID=2884804 RepID=A0ABS8D2X3_9NEIS|nr:helix-turn-helix transcriptional regulator [Leeia speluncae]MCB6181998.1 helix-turn-helix transcriptional regulator [Leeia speluncae]